MNKLPDVNDAVKAAQNAYEAFTKDQGIVRAVGSPEYGHDRNGIKAVANAVRHSIRKGYITREQSIDEQHRAAYRLLPAWVLGTVAKVIIEWAIRWLIDYYMKEPIGAAPNGHANLAEPESTVVNPDAG